MATVAGVAALSAAEETEETEDDTEDDEPEDDDAEDVEAGDDEETDAAADEVAAVAWLTTRPPVRPIMVAALTTPVTTRARWAGWGRLRRTAGWGEVAGMNPWWCSHLRGP